MMCPYCLSVRTGCIDSRQHEEIRRRRYQCRQCGDRFSTSEIVTEYNYTKVRKEDRLKWRIVSR